MCSRSQGGFLRFIQPDVGDKGQVIRCRGAVRKGTSRSGIWVGCHIGGERGWKGGGWLSCVVHVWIMDGGLRGFIPMLWPETASAETTVTIVSLRCKSIQSARKEGLQVWQNRQSPDPCSVHLHDCPCQFSSHLQISSLSQPSPDCYLVFSCPFRHSKYSSTRKKIWNSKISPHVLSETSRKPVHPKSRQTETTITSM